MSTTSSDDDAARMEDIAEAEDMPGAQPVEEEQVTGKGKKRKAPSAPIKFTEEQVRIAIEFLQDRPHMYDKTHPDYKDFPLRKRKWAALAEILDVSEKALNRWYRSVRVMLAKAKRKQCKSGSGGSLTERQTELSDRFRFLSPHVKVHTPANVLGAKRSRRPSSASLDLDQPGRSTQEPSGQSPTGTPTACAAASTCSPSTGARPNRKVQEDYGPYLKLAVDTFLVGLEKKEVNPFWDAMAKRAAEVPRDVQREIEDAVYAVVSERTAAYFASQHAMPAPASTTTMSQPTPSPARPSTSTYIQLHPPPLGSFTTQGPTPTSLPDEYPMDYLLQSPPRFSTPPRRSPRKSTPRRVHPPSFPATASSSEPASTVDTEGLGFTFHDLQ